jgi:photosystem II stability/assembly factor-like uncharacterized protein
MPYCPRALGLAVGALGLILAVLGAAPSRSASAATAGSRNTLMRFIDSAPPVSDAPGAGPLNLAFVSPKVGYTATTGGYRFVGRVGPVAAIDDGRIQRTDDGGVIWRTLWKRRGVVFDAISASGKTVVAFGRFLKLVRQGDSWGERRGSMFLLATSNGGQSWRRLPPIGTPELLQVVTPTTWITALAGYGQPGNVLFRTEDAGRHWRRLKLPLGTGFVRFASASLGFAGAPSPSCSPNALWRSINGGASWHVIHGTCGPPLIDVDPVSERIVFAVQSDTAWSTNRPPGVIRRTIDGGESWSVQWRSKGYGILEAAFSDAESGFVVDQRWYPGTSGGYVCPRARATEDGGRTWSLRALPYSTRGACMDAAGGGSRLPTAFVGARYAWAGDEGGGVVWRTTDGGITWRVTAEPRTLGQTELDWSLQRATTGPVVETAAGPIRTHDRGSSWFPARSVSRKEDALASGLVSYLKYVGPRGGVWSSAVMVTSNEGRSWRRIRLPGNRLHGADAAAFRTPNHGVVELQSGIYTTRDGGATWKQLREPKSLPSRPIFSLGPGIIVTSSNEKGGRTPPMLTTDGGKSWRRVGEPGDGCGIGSRPGEHDIWLQCQRGPYDDPTVVLLISHDAGKTWTRRTRQMHTTIVVTGQHEAWAVTEPYHQSELVRNIPKRLWHTTDDGSTWRRAWVALSPDLVFRQVTLG